MRLGKEQVSVRKGACILYVVNGCQSLMAFEKNKNAITDNLYVLTKFVQVDPASQLARQITEYSNNQNGVTARDFKANSSTQIRVKNEFASTYASQYAYSVKRGEPIEPSVLIGNEDAGLYLMAFDLKEPWATHRKYQVSDDKYADIFARPNVTTDRIVMLQIMKEEIDEITSITTTLPPFGHIWPVFSRKSLRGRQDHKAVKRVGRSP